MQGGEKAGMQGREKEGGGVKARERGEGRDERMQGRETKGGRNAGREKAGGWGRERGERLPRVLAELDAPPPAGAPAAQSLRGEPSTVYPVDGGRLR